MEQGTPGNARPCRVVAAEVTTEQDSKKLAKLVEELNRALEEQAAVKPGGYGKGEKVD
jgi:hypothetical protein